MSFFYENPNSDFSGDLRVSVNPVYNHISETWDAPVVYVDGNPVCGSTLTRTYREAQQRSHGMTRVPGATKQQRYEWLRDHDALPDCQLCGYFVRNGKSHDGVCRNLAINAPRGANQYACIHFDPKAKPENEETK